MRDTWQVYPNVVAVTPNDSANLPAPSMALWVTGTGAIAFDTVGGQTNVVLTGIPANTIVPIQMIRVRATGTTATGLFALY